MRARNEVAGSIALCEGRGRRRGRLTHARWADASAKDERQSRGLCSHRRERRRRRGGASERNTKLS